MYRTMEANNYDTAEEAIAAVKNGSDIFSLRTSFLSLFF